MPDLLLQMVEIGCRADPGERQEWEVPRIVRLKDTESNLVGLWESVPQG